MTDGPTSNCLCLTESAHFDRRAEFVIKLVVNDSRNVSLKSDDSISQKFVHFSIGVSWSSFEWVSEFGGSWTVKQAATRFKREIWVLFCVGITSAQSAFKLFDHG